MASITITPLIETFECSLSEGAFGFSFTETQMFKDGILYADIIERNGNNLKVRIISDNKYLDGVIQEVRLFPKISI